MIHSHYLSGKQWSTSKTGQHYNHYEANPGTQIALFKLGYKYYYKKSLGFFGENILLKVKETKTINGEVYCVCLNTINFEYLIKPEDLYLNL